MGVPLPNPSSVVLLGAQRFNPYLREAVDALGITGRIATITAGWQERETDDDDLVQHLDGRAVNLRLHARGDEVFRDDPELHSAHRERQELLRDLQDVYRVRLESALDAERILRERKTPLAIRDEIEAAALQSIRDLDLWHLEQCARLRHELDARLKPMKRPALRRHREELSTQLADCDAVAIAGGHVATLVNRLRLFGIADLVGTRPVFAWSGGAMVVSERIVLFHDDPPQGPGATEVLDAGLGLVKDVVVLPQPEHRLHLDNMDRVRLMARRFAPAMCLAFPARSHAVWQRDVGPVKARGVDRLREDGCHTAFEPGDAT